MPGGAVESFVARSIGLDPAAIGEDAVSRAVRARLDALGLRDEQAYLEQLRGAPREFDELVQAVVVPETWFFRESGAFAVLREFALKEWHTGRPALRILSAPCATGEEPYSIAIALLEAGLPAQAFRIDAADVCRAFLAQAEGGQFGPHSFRGAWEPAWEPYFEPRQAASPAFPRQIGPAARERVRFFYGNLLDPTFRLGQPPYPLVFCRNLLIYLHQEAREQVLRTLDRLVAPGGILFMGHAEPVSRPGYQRFPHARAFAYRRAAEAGGRRTEERQQLSAERGCAVVSPPPASGLRPPACCDAQSPAPSPQAPGPCSKRSSLDVAREYADAGLLDQATEACERHLREHGPSAEAFFLLGLVRQVAGQAQAAKDLLRRAVDLDPQHEGAVWHLSMMAQRRYGSGLANRRGRSRQVGTGTPAGPGYSAHRSADGRA